jgi:hypothetical protein
VVKVHKGALGPESLLQLLPGDHFAGALEQHGQDLQRLAAQPELYPVLAQLLGPKVKFKGPEALDMCRPIQGNLFQSSLLSFIHCSSCLLRILPLCRRGSRTSDNASYSL